jgi:hypothetical protein
MVTFSLIAMFGLLGLVVDIGWAYFRRHAAQAAADAAALAAVEAAVAGGSGAFPCESNGVACHAEPCPAAVPEPPAHNLHNGCLYAAANGFPNRGLTTAAMEAGLGPTAPTAPGATVRYWVTARVGQRLPQLFSAVLGNTLLTASARATAGVFVTGENACLYVLDPAAPAAFVADGAPEVSAAGCDIYVNSRDPQAMVVAGGGSVTAASVSVVGGVDTRGDPAAINPNPVTHAPAIQDPFASLPAPPVGACDQTGWRITGGDSAVLDPGVYCGGLDISGQASVTLRPGVYVLNGGGLSMSGHAKLSGAGVTIFNTAQGYDFGPVNVAGGADVHLAAPDSGTYKGILFFQDRNLASPPESHFVGGSTMHLNGSVYYPSGGIRFAGGGDSDFTALLARTVIFTGNSSFRPDPTGSHTGVARRIVALIE